MTWICSWIKCSQYCAAASFMERIGLLINAHDKWIMFLVLVDELHHLLNRLRDRQALNIRFDPQLFDQLLGRLQIRHGSNGGGWMLEPTKERVAVSLFRLVYGGRHDVQQEQPCLVTGVCGINSSLLRGHVIPITQSQGCHLDMKWRHTTLTTTQRHSNSNNRK